jgi:hypothetical protein
MNDISEDQNHGSAAIRNAWITIYHTLTAIATNRVGYPIRSSAPVFPVTNDDVNGM